MKETLALVTEIGLPVDDIADRIAARLAPRIEAKVAASVAEHIPRRRSPTESLDAAIMAVIKAVDRVDTSRNSRDENPSINALVAPAAGLRSARRAVQRRG